METVEQLPPSQEEFVCLSVFNLIFLYIYFTTELNVWPSTWCTCFCVNAADAFPCSLQNVKMFNVTMLSLFRDSSFVFWGRGWDGVDDYFRNVDKDNYLNGNRDMTIPTFPQFLSRCMLVCSRTGCLFIAPEKYAKGANSKGDLLERWAGRLRSSFYFNPQCLMRINHHLIPAAQRAEACAPPLCCTSHPTHCCLLNAAVRFCPGRVLTINQSVGLASQLPSLLLP